MYRMRHDYRGEDGHGNWWCTLTKQGHVIKYHYHSSPVWQCEQMARAAKRLIWHGYIRVSVNNKWYGNRYQQNGNLTVRLLDSTKWSVQPCRRCT